MGVILLGAGGHCKQVIDIFTENNVEIIGIYDDEKTGVWYGIQILGTIKELNYRNIINHKLFCCIGDNEVRRNLLYRFIDYTWINCIAKKARISKSVKMGVGNYIGGLAQILSDSLLGDGNIINEGVVITHDISIGHFNHIAPGTVICGNCRIGDLNLLGAGSIVLPKTTIKDNNIFGSGAVINRNLDSDATYVGVPVRKLVKE